MVTKPLEALSFNAVASYLRSAVGWTRSRPSAWTQPIG